MIPPQDPLVLALERDNRENKNKSKRCCSSCDIGQRCTKWDKIHQEINQELMDAFKSPPKGQVDIYSDTDSEDIVTSLGSPISS